MCMRSTKNRAVEYQYVMCNNTMINVPSRTALFLNHHGVSHIKNKVELTWTLLLPQSTITLPCLELAVFTVDANSECGSAPFQTHTHYTLSLSRTVV